MAEEESRAKMATSSAELLQAEAELVRHSLGYLKSMALHSAVKLGIPDALHRCGGAASLPDLLSTLALPCSKRPYLSRLMKMLAVEGIFTAVAAVDVPAAGEGEGAAAAPSVRYGLNPVSRLLVSGGVSPCVLMGTSPLFLEASLRLPQWFQRDSEGEPAFAMAHGESPYAATGHDMEFNALVNEAMGSDSRYMAELVVRECGEVFTGVTSLVDVGGGNGTMATAIAKAFPHVRCSVLDLPHVVQGVVSTHESVEFAAGDMMEYVPPADAVLLKCVLHNWSDEDCVKILTKCREAIAQGAKAGAGKVIIIDAVVGSPSHSQVLEAQVLMDMQMMMLFMSKEREELNWQKIFMEAGFSHYKIQPVLGMRSIIQLYP
ncbi:flavonoid O-methyltransferase-like protein Os11g0303600 [Aegilops tauschii subsp. strangulata]|uniref:O-methyltransferase ZRP4 n=2 Tax=Aegilops tauschii subsp. strangulata TaxID=200361 RepID=A0A453CUZ8_AEGTS|nr:acetylserotonin O-methyltransferase 1 [Aegilops tauschii subsp. strangulata]